ncbi:MAG TPA: tyrosine-type recombinase/integrase [Planctomycetota bacterium]|nr:tyrosine-type recombinase/integrase [Planctomycetota bacterium]
MQHLEDWSASLVAVSGRSPSTATRYARAIGKMAERLGTDPSVIERSDLNRYVKELYAEGYSSSSRAVTLNAIKGFFSYLATCALIAQNPALHLDTPRVYRREMPTLTKGEIDRLIYEGGEGLLPASSPIELRNRVLLYTMYILGLRISEPGRLRLDDVEWDTDSLVFTVLIREAKAARADKRMTLDRPGSRLLGMYLQGTRAAIMAMPKRSSRKAPRPPLFPGAGGGPLSSSAVGAIFRQRVAASGIDRRGRRVTPHILRHSIATHLLAAGWSERAVQEWMRHRSLETTALYMHVDTSQFAAKLARAHPLGPRRRSPNLQSAAGELVRELTGRGRDPDPTIN